MEHETHSETEAPKEEKVNKLDTQSISSAIIFCGVLIAASIFFSGKTSQPVAVSGSVENAKIDAVTEQKPQVAGTLRPVSKDDHIRGSLDAKLILVEFSDPECPYCKEFHGILKQAMAKYGSNNNLAWVYRNFPIDGLHKKARNESLATECAGLLGGNDVYWQYLDELFVRTNSNDSLDPAQLPSIAKDLGLDVTAFTSCVTSGRTAARVSADIADGVAVGVEGTPHSILVNTKTGKLTGIRGMVSFDVLQKIINEALASK